MLCTPLGSSCNDRNLTDVNVLNMEGLSFASQKAMALRMSYAVQHGAGFIDIKG